MSLRTEIEQALSTLHREAGEAPSHLRYLIDEVERHLHLASDAPTIEAHAEPEDEPESEEPEAAPADAVDLGTMTIAELRAHAEANGIDLGDAKKKAEIIDAIEAHAEPEDEPESEA